ncbi:MAG TPA: DUF5947 family protein [Anaeromyxobacteraceae bacterium]|nr:DUF5947 family protein [Anaeromyxobacteraceae bacterium]
MNALEALGRYARRPRAAPAVEVCELCAAPAGERHRHVVDLERRAVCCACATCAMLFVQSGGGGRYRTIPERVVVEPALSLAQEQWAELQIPVGLAFVFFSSSVRRWVALYPSPAGAIESELPLEAWRALAEQNALVASAEPDVEALLVHAERGAPTCECLLAPIDACYELVGRIRRRWKGLDGGDAVRDEIAAFLDQLRARGKPLRRKDSGDAR